MRLDLFIFKKGLFDSRNKASQAIERGEIYVDGTQILKSSFEILNENCLIERRCEQSFVSVGGFKLDKALKDFKFNVNGFTVADIGSSTGGFTDCLLKNGAKKVYAVDLNDELLHETLKQNDRVIRIIKNAKELSREDFKEGLDLICADLSFISATHVLKVFYDLLDYDKQVILLIKPQFETDKKMRFKNGIIKDDKIRLQCCEKVFNFAVSCGFYVEKITTAPINKEKNTEYLILLKKCNTENIEFDKIFIQ